MKIERGNFIVILQIATTAFVLTKLDKRYLKQFYKQNKSHLPERTQKLSPAMHEVRHILYWEIP